MTHQRAIEINLKLLPGKGLCFMCSLNEGIICELNLMLMQHRYFRKQFGPQYQYIEPALWEEYAIDEPDYIDTNTITWCPLFEKVKD